MDFSCSGFMAGSCCARRQALWKRSKKAVRSAEGSQAGTSQNRSEMTSTFTLTIMWIIRVLFNWNAVILNDDLHCYTCAIQNGCSYLGMESQARGRTFHAASEAASISLQCGIHLFTTEGKLLDLYFLPDQQH